MLRGETSLYISKDTFANVAPKAPYGPNNNPKINNTPVQSNGQIFKAKPDNNITEQERKIIVAQLAQFLTDFDQVSNKDKNAKINFL